MTHARIHVLEHHVISGLREWRHLRYKGKLYSVVYCPADNLVEVLVAHRRHGAIAASNTRADADTARDVLTQLAGLGL